MKEGRTWGRISALAGRCDRAMDFSGIEIRQPGCSPNDKVYKVSTSFIFIYTFQKYTIIRDIVDRKILCFYSFKFTVADNSW